MFNWLNLNTYIDFEKLKIIKVGFITFFHKFFENYIKYSISKLH